MLSTLFFSSFTLDCRFQAGLFHCFSPFFFVFSLDWGSLFCLFLLFRFFSSLFFSFSSSFRFLCQARQHNTMMMVINTITTTPMITAAEPVSLSDVSVAGVILHSGRDSLLKERRLPLLKHMCPRHNTREQNLRILSKDNSFTLQLKDWNIILALTHFRSIETVVDV